MGIFSTLTMFLGVLELGNGQPFPSAVCPPSALSVQYAQYQPQPDPQATVTALKNCEKSVPLYGWCHGSQFYSGISATKTATTPQLHYHKVSIPAGTAVVVFTTTVGYLQLYVRRNGLPARDAGLHDYKDDSTTYTTKVITVIDPPAGDYYALLKPTGPKFKGVHFKTCFCSGEEGNSTPGDTDGGCCGKDLEKNLYYVVGAATALILLILIILILIVCCCLSSKIGRHSN